MREVWFDEGGGEGTLELACLFEMWYRLLNFVVRGRHCVAEEGGGYCWVMA